MSDELHDLDDLPAQPRIEISDADRKLLRQAATALGAAHVEEVDGEGYVSLYFADGTIVHGWNPLRFSGDAFDLQVSLDVYVFQSLEARETQAAGPGQRVIYQPWGDDKASATRRAATRAAAEIGKQHS